jgi:hypothetical protein
MYIAFLILTILLCVAEVLATIKTHRIWHFLLASILLLAAAIGLDFVAGIIGDRVTGDFHIAAFFWQLLPFVTGTVWAFFTFGGIVAMYVKEPHYTIKHVLKHLSAVALIALCVIAVYTVKKHMETASLNLNSYPPIVTSGMDFYGGREQKKTIVITDRQTGKDKVVGDLYLEDITSIGGGECIGALNDKNDSKIILFNVKNNEGHPIFNADNYGYTHLGYPVFDKFKKNLYFIADYREIVKFDLFTGEVTTILPGEKKLWPGRFAVSPDERHVYFFYRHDDDGLETENNMIIWEIDTQTLEKTELVKEDNQIDGLDLSIDGKELYYVCDHRLIKLDLATKEFTQLLSQDELTLAGAPGNWPVRVSSNNRYILLNTGERNETWFKVAYSAYAYDIQENKVVQVMKSYYDPGFIDWIEY